MPDDRKIRTEFVYGIIKRYIESQGDKTEEQI